MGSTHISLNNNFTIPENKPDIQALLRIGTTPVIDKTITMKKKILFTGHLDICIEYAAVSPDGMQNTHFSRSQVPFKSLLLHPWARNSVTATLKARIRLCTAERIDPRTISIIVLLKICKIRFSRLSHSHNCCDKKKSSSLPPHCPQPCSTMPYPVTTFTCNKPETFNNHVLLKPCDTLPYPLLENQIPKLYNSSPSVSPIEAPASPQTHYSVKNLNSQSFNTSSSTSSFAQQDFHLQPNNSSPSSIALCCDTAANCETTCKQAPYKYEYTSYNSGYCKTEGREPFPDTYYTPTSIQPYTRIETSHGVAFSNGYEE